MDWPSHKKIEDILSFSPSFSTWGRHKNAYKASPEIYNLTRNQQRYFRLFVINYLMELIKNFILSNIEIDIDIYDKLVRAYTPSNHLLRQDKKVRDEWRDAYRMYKKLPFLVKDKSIEPKCGVYPSTFLSWDISYYEKYIKLRNDIIATCDNSMRKQVKDLCQKILNKHLLF